MKLFEFPRRIIENYETLHYFHERTKKRREKSFPTMYYAHMKHPSKHNVTYVSCNFLLNNVIVT